jgi:hypothetical protein
MLGVTRAVAVLVCLYALALPVRAQQRVDPRNRYERVLAIVPLTGNGTVEDPILPMYAPSPSASSVSATDPASRGGIIAYTYVPSDDGKFALVEYVARDRAAFKTILSDRSVTAFVKGTHNLADAIAVFKQFKKDFDITTFGMRVQ